MYTTYTIRMFPSIYTNCLKRWCNYKDDFLNHIMQICRFNYNNIIHRNNYVNNILITLLNKYKFKTILEPHMRIQLGLQCKLYTNPTYWHTEMIFICYRFSDLKRYHR